MTWQVASQIFVLVVVDTGFVTAVFLICSVYKVIQIETPSVLLLFPLCLADVLNFMRLKASRKPSAGSLQFPNCFFSFFFLVQKWIEFYLGTAFAIHLQYLSTKAGSFEKGNQGKFLKGVFNCSFLASSMSFKKYLEEGFFSLILRVYHEFGDSCFFTHESLLTFILIISL